MVGNLSFSEASRIHMAVWGSSGPTDRYSAMPSTNHSGSLNTRGNTLGPWPTWVMSN